MKRQASLPHNQIESEIAPVVLGTSDSQLKDKSDGGCLHLRSSVTTSENFFLK